MLKIMESDVGVVDCECFHCHKKFCNTCHHWWTHNCAEGRAAREKAMHSSNEELYK